MAYNWQLLLLTSIKNLANAQAKLRAEGAQLALRDQNLQAA